jgi:hypothetical protein
VLSIFVKNDLISAISFGVLSLIMLITFVIQSKDEK